MIQITTEAATEVIVIETRHIALETDSETHKVTDVQTDLLSPLQINFIHQFDRIQ